MSAGRAVKSVVGSLVKVIDKSLSRFGQNGVIVVDDRSSYPYKIQFDDGQDERGNWFSKDAVQIIKSYDAHQKVQSIFSSEAKRRKAKLGPFSSNNNHTKASTTVPGPVSDTGNVGASSSNPSTSSNITLDTKRDADVIKKVQLYLRTCTEYEQNLAKEVTRYGGVVKAYPGLRPDGVRGLIAPVDFAKDEMILTIPSQYVMHFDVARPSVRSAIDTALSAAGIPPTSPERHVYEKTVALCVELMLERRIIERFPDAASSSSTNNADGSRDPSFWRAYVTSLPEPPHTINLYPPQIRDLFVKMLGQDLVSMYTGLLALIVSVAQELQEEFKACGSTAPNQEEVKAEFFFVLSRLSYMRLIPYIDLANAALPDEQNVRIQPDQNSGNCYLYALRDIAAGEELCIDYNHRNGISLMASYGFSMGLENLRSSFKVPIVYPPLMRGYGAKDQQIQLLTTRPPETGGFPSRILLTLRMGTLGNEEEMLEAAESGYLQEQYLDESRWPKNKNLEKWRAWRDRERASSTYAQLQKFCEKHLTVHTHEIEPLINSLNAESVGDAAVEFKTHLVAQTVAIDQAKTNRTLLLRLLAFLKR